MKAKIEMAFLWMTFEDMLEVKIMPARVHAFFELAHAPGKA